MYLSSVFSEETVLHTDDTTGGDEKKMEILSLSKRGCAFSEFSGCLNGVNDVDSQMNEQRTTNVH